MRPSEQVISVTIDNSSVFVPGGGTGEPQYGFRRTELIAQQNNSSSALDEFMEVNTTTFHFSISHDDSKPLNYSHEYQIVFIEPGDGSHVFGVQLGTFSSVSFDTQKSQILLGSPFTNPTGILPVEFAHHFKILDHDLNVLFKTPFYRSIWHNFAIEVDWTALTLAVYYSQGRNGLKAVTPTTVNADVASGPTGQGDFHFGVLKVQDTSNPLARAI